MNADASRSKSKPVPCVGIPAEADTHFLEADADALAFLKIDCHGLCWIAV